MAKKNTYVIIYVHLFMLEITCFNFIFCEYTFEESLRFSHFIPSVFDSIKKHNPIFLVFIFVSLINSVLGDFEKQSLENSKKFLNLTDMMRALYNSIKRSFRLLTDLIPNLSQGARSTHRKKTNHSNRFNIRTIN